MDVSTALRTRRSTRAFKPDPVPHDLLMACLEDAGWAPSWSNTQPYRVAVASGRLRDTLSAELCARFDAGLRLLKAPRWRQLIGVWRGEKPRSDFPVPMTYPDDLQEARRAAGLGLYERLGIRRDDRASRDRQMRRNYEFFGAPVALVVFAHAGLGAYAPVDAGVFLQSFLLAAHARGLGTCAQAALAVFADPVRAAFAVPPSYRLLVGCSVGFPADHPVNSYNPGRRPVADLMLPGLGADRPRR